MRNKKTLTILLVVMILAVVVVPVAVLADTSGAFTGSITLSSDTAPEITTFTLTNDTIIAPTGTMDVALTVSDADGFSDISEIMLLYWYTTEAGDPADFPAAFDPATNDSSTEAWFRVWDGSSFFADDSNTTWSSTDPLALPDGSTVNSHTFNFTVTMGREAREVSSVSDTNKWVIAVKVTDSNNNEAFQLYSPGMMLASSFLADMSADPNAGPYWDTGTAGMTYGGSAGSQVFDGMYTLTVISNGDYSLETYVDNTWSNGTTDITYNTGLANDDEFSLAIDTQDSYNFTGTAQELQNDPGALGHTDPLIITPPAEWGTRTDFDGVLITNIYMYLQTSAVMTTSADAYEGTVTFTVVNN